MSCNHAATAKLTLRFEHIDEEEFQLSSGATYFEKEACHVPRKGDVVALPKTFYPYDCDVEEVIWDFEGAPPHVIIKVSS